MARAMVPWLCNMPPAGRAPVVLRGVLVPLGRLGSS